MLLQIGCTAVRGRCSSALLDADKACRMGASKIHRVHFVPMMFVMTLRLELDPRLGTARLGTPQASVPTDGSGRSRARDGGRSGHRQKLRHLHRPQQGSDSFPRLAVSRRMFDASADRTPRQTWPAFPLSSLSRQGMPRPYKQNPLCALCANDDRIGSMSRTRRAAGDSPARDT